jgi:hypothetical protein
VTFIFTAARTSIPSTSYHSWHSQMLPAYISNDRYRNTIPIHLPQNCLPWPHFVKSQSPENRRTTSRDSPSPPAQKLMPRHPPSQAFFKEGILFPSPHVVLQLSVLHLPWYCIDLIGKTLSKGLKTAFNDFKLEKRALRPKC